MKIFDEIIYLPEFEKDLKKLTKKFPSLRDDLQEFIHSQLNLTHKLKMDNGGVVRIPNLPFQMPPVYKARKFACRSLKGSGSKSGIRVIYTYFADQDKIEFVEIYFKGDQENESRARIVRKYG